MSMRISLLIYLACILLLACNPNKSQKVAPDQVRFTTSDASELFFKNVRQLHYDKNTMDAAKLDIYRNKDRDTSRVDPVLNLAIAVNWRYDEAYLLLEPNDPLQDLDTIKILWKDTVRQQQGYYTFGGGSKEDQFNFAAQLYQGLQNEQRFFLISPEGEPVLFMSDRKSREAFRKTAFDYFRLVDLL